MSIAAVVAKSDDHWREMPCALIELEKGDQPSNDEIPQHCQASLAGFKVPKFFIFSDLPKTATKKIPKAELREQAKDI